MYITKWKLMLTWLLVSLFLLVSQDTLSQVKAIHFNAGWNKQNTAEWFDKLGDCEKQSFMIDGNDLQKKYQIAIVPTIVIFDDGEEVKRFQADISFKMSATREDVQDYIDELIMSKF